MPSLRILIVEDEIIIARDLKEQLIDFGYQIVGIAKNSQIAISLFNEFRPDIVLMDIILQKSDFDGIEIAKIFNTLKKVPIIYLTGSHNQRIHKRAKSTLPANYLIKPCNEKQLQAAIELAIYNFTHEQEATFRQIRPVVPETQQLYPTKDCIFIRNKELFVKVTIENLLWVKAANTYVELATVADDLVLSTGLKSFLEQFPHPLLHRVHRSYAANLSKVNAFDGGHIYILNGEVKHKIPVAPQYREDIFRNFPKLRTKI